MPGLVPGSTISGLHEVDRRVLSVGQIASDYPKSGSSPRIKNIPLSASGKSALALPPSRPEEGRRPSSPTLGRDAVDATASVAQVIAGRDEPRERRTARK